MTPASFEQANTVFHPPPGTDPDECSVLNTFKSQDRDGNPVIVSCWKITDVEWEEIEQYKRVWLWINGHTMPPVYVSGQNPWS